MQLLGNKLSHRLADGIVVAPDESRVFIAVSLAVVDDNRNALVVSTIDGRRDGIQLIRSYHQQIHLLVNHLIDLPSLQLAVIIGRSQLDLDGVVEILSHLQFLIKLVSPKIFRALRYANDILRSSLSATPRQQVDTYYNI